VPLGEQVLVVGAEWVESEATVVVLSPQMPLWRAAMVAFASSMATARAPSRVKYRRAT